MGNAMAIKNKMILSGLALYLLSGATAYAEINVGVNLGGPAYVVASPPVYVSPYPYYYDPRHRNHDFGYWEEQRRIRERRDHWDNGRHEGWNNDHRDNKEQGRRGHERR